MITHTSSPVKFSKKETKMKKQGKVMFSAHQLLKSFGILLTLVWGTAALAPHLFNLPLNMRPWIFVTFIFWFIAFCAGVFSS